MDDLYVDVPKSGCIIRESPGIRLIDNKWGLRDRSDSEHDSEANFRHGGRKRHETITPTNIEVSLGDDFVYDIEGCSTKLANLNEVPLFYFDPPVSFYKRKYLDCPVFNPSPLFFFFFSFFLFFLDW